MEDEILDIDEIMHEQQEWEANYFEKQVDFYEYIQFFEISQIK